MKPNPIRVSNDPEKGIVTINDNKNQVDVVFFPSSQSIAVWFGKKGGKRDLYKFEVNMENDTFVICRWEKK